MSECWEVRLDGFPWFPEEPGCLLLILLTERNKHPPRQLPLHLYPRALLQSWHRSLSSSFSYRLLLSACFLKSSPRTWRCPSGIEGPGNKKKIKKKKKEKEQNPPTHPSQSGSLFNSCSLPQTRSQLAFEHIPIFQTVRAEQGKLFWWPTNLSSHQLIKQSGLNVHYYLKLTKEDIIPFRERKTPQMAPFSPHFRREAINCWHRQETFVSIKHKTPRCSFLPVWGRPAHCEYLRVSHFPCSSLHIFNISHMNGN